MWQRIKELLAETDQSTFGRPSVHEVLKRPNNYKTNYNKWLESGALENTLEWLLSNYHSKISGGKSDRSIAFLDTPSKKGFVLYLMDEIEVTRKPEYLMDFLKNRIIDLGYNLYTSDLKSYIVKADVETQQRHYLKPPLNFVPDKKLSQLFGNISIEYVLRNDRPYMFKFSATTYQDYMFEDAVAFDELMRMVCVH